MKERIIKFADLINTKRNKYWYILKPDIEAIFESNNVDELLIQFESSVEYFEKQKKPELTLIFFMALLILYDKQDKYSYLIKQTNNKNYIKYLKAGLKKYIQGKSNSFRYKHKLGYEGYKNPYNFIERFSGWLPNYEMNFRGFLNVIEFFLHKDQESFFEILSVDSQNAMALTAILNPRIELDWGYLHKWLIKSDDELKQNVALYYVLNKSKYVIQRSSNANEKVLQDYFENLSSFLESIPSEIAPKLLLNYLFTERQTLTVVFEYFEKVNARDLIEFELKSRKINLFEICILNLLCQYVQDREALEGFMLKKFFEWLNFNCIESEWDKYKIDLINNFLKRNSNINSNLNTIENSLYVHDFDREIRFKKYLRDVVKLRIIHEIRDAI